MALIDGDEEPGSWRLRIEHVTEHRYAGEVTASYNEARITPVTDERQLTLDARVETTPRTRPLRYWDHFGTQVVAFDLHQPHTRLTVTGTAIVETSPAPTQLPPGDWEAYDEACCDALVEWLRPTTSTATDGPLAAVGRQVRAEPSPLAATRAAVAWVRERLVYEPGRTQVRTSAVEARDGGVGVCQDFTHLSLAVLRAAGVPSRYVSGYLHPVPDAPVGTTVAGESHAWFEIWLPDGDGGVWAGFDPTNDVPAGERHVAVGRGRDYHDVPPAKGIYAGGPADTMAVTVEVTRLR